MVEDCVGLVVNLMCIIASRLVFLAQVGKDLSFYVHLDLLYASELSRTAIRVTSGLGVKDRKSERCIIAWPFLHACRTNVRA